MPVMSFWPVNPRTSPVTALVIVTVAPTICVSSTSIKVIVVSMAVAAPFSV